MNLNDGVTDEVLLTPVIHLQFSGTLLHLTEAHPTSDVQLYRDPQMASRHSYLSQQLPSETQRIRQCWKQHTHLSAGTYQARGLYKTTHLPFLC